MNEKYISVDIMSTARGMKPLEERMVDERSYVVVPETATEYAVKVSFRKNEQGQWPFGKVKIGCYVDGQDCNYWKRLDFEILEQSMGATAFFLGFRTSGDDVRSFTFAKTVADHNDASPGHVGVPSSGLGEIKVVVHTALAVVDAMYENKAGQHVVPSGSQKVMGNKKFWQQASLNTCAGRSVTEKFEPIMKWVLNSTIPDVTIIRPYHSSAMLDTIEDITSRKRRRVDPDAPKVTVDLTGDGEEEKAEESDDDEVQQVAAPPKMIPSMDLTGEEARELPDVRVN